METGVITDPTITKGLVTMPLVHDQDTELTSAAQENTQKSAPLMMCPIDFDEKIPVWFSWHLQCIQEDNTYLDIVLLGPGRRQ